MHVASIGLQIEYGVADDLSRSVIGHISTAAGFVHGDAKLRELCVCGDDVRAAAVAFYTKRDDRWMLQEQQEIRDASGATLFDELPLHGERLVVRHHAQATDFELAHHGSQRRLRSSVPPLLRVSPLAPHTPLPTQTSDRNFRSAASLRP